MKKITYRSYTNHNRRKEISVARLRFGHNRLHDTKKIGLHEDGLCTTCRLPENTERYSMECRATGIREESKRKCYEERIKFNIEDILNNKKS